jgi:hypothetical protein
MLNNLCETLRTFVRSDPRTVGWYGRMEWSWRMGASMRTERAIERKQDQGTRRTALDNGRDFLGKNGIIDGNTSVRLDIMPHPQ